MQRLEVSGAVRPIYGSLGVKRLKYMLKTKYPFTSASFSRRTTLILNSFSAWATYIWMVKKHLHYCGPFRGPNLEKLWQISGIHNFIDYCLIFIVCIHNFTIVATGRIIQAGGPRVGDPCFSIYTVMAFHYHVIRRDTDFFRRAHTFPSFIFCNLQRKTWLFQHTFVKFSSHCFTNCLINHYFTVLHYKRCLHFVNCTPVIPLAVCLVPNSTVQERVL